MLKKGYFLGFLLVIFSCNLDDNHVNVYQYCNAQPIGLTQANANIMMFSEGVFQEIQWQVRYFETTVELSYWGGNCGDDCKLQKVFMFKKNGACIEFDYAFTRANHIFNGVDVNEINLPITFELQEWVEDQKFVGQLIIDETITEKFWITQTPEDSYFLPNFPEYNTFEACIESQLPITVDVNHDGLDDFAFDFNQQHAQNRLPRRTYSYLTFNAINTNDFILISPNYDVVFSSDDGDITSENKGNIIEANVGLFTEFNTPYNAFNNWQSFANNGVFDQDIINYNSNSYFLIKKTINNQEFFGWINFSIDFYNCTISVEATYLNDTANEHVVIN